MDANVISKMFFSDEKPKKFFGFIHHLVFVWWFKNQIQHISTRVTWWKACNKFSFSIYVSGSECETGFWFTIPYLFGFSVTKFWKWDVFKNRFPEIQKDDAEYTAVSVSIDREQIFTRWKDFDTGDSMTSKRNYWYFDWDKLYVVKKQTALLPMEQQTLEVRVDIEYPTKVRHKAVAFTMKTEMGFRHYRFGFKRKFYVFTLQSSEPFIVPGKGENSWDMEDEVLLGLNPDDTFQTRSYRKLSAKQVIEQFTAYYHRKLNR